MPTALHHRLAGALLALLLALPVQALNILLTNDDGWDGPGIQALFTALSDAGHDVTMVAPLEQNSGKGGGMMSEVGHYVAVKREREGQWSVASTPTDAVRAGLDVILADNPPDLVISGANFGQNLGRPTTHQSGTIGAALQSLFRGVPAIAVSVGVRFDEASAQPQPFPSTLESFGPAAKLVVDLLSHLETDTGIALPAQTALNINVPPPYRGERPVRRAQLAVVGAVEMQWQRGEKTFGAEGGELQVMFRPAPQEVLREDDDITLYHQGYVTVTALDGDMSANSRLEQLPTLIEFLNRRD